MPIVHVLPWIGLLAVLAGAAAWWLRGYLRLVVFRRRMARGRDGEARAAGLLRRRGYEVLDDQPSRRSGLWVDGNWRPVSVRADYLVARRGRTYVVEVKTGNSAPDPTETATRRQLLEYRHVYDADGVILVDMNRGRLHRVRFDRPAEGIGTTAAVVTRPWGMVAGALAAGVVLGAALAWAM
jgi:Holliday junction resolvase-like predicted endonuclease